LTIFGGSRRMRLHPSPVRAEQSDNTRKVCPCCRMTATRIKASKGRRGVPSWHVGRLLRSRVLTAAFNGLYYPGKDNVFPWAEAA
jgi:hypothetical protein